MRTCTLIFSLLPLFPLLGWTQETKSAPKTSYSPIPVADASRPNPVKSTPESIAQGKKIYAYDCAQCHGTSGDGKTEAGKNIKTPDFTDPAFVKDHSDGELFYVIKNGRGAMPPEGDRVRPDELWDLVNYVRSLAKRKASAEEKPRLGMPAKNGILKQIVRGPVFLDDYHHMCDQVRGQRS
ncbi:MAG: cytochrome c [Terriglobales bacterium]